jgi:hypothetical protein
MEIIFDALKALTRHLSGSNFTKIAVEISNHGDEMAAFWCYLSGFHTPLLIMRSYA